MNNNLEDIKKLAEILKLIAETEKIEKEAKWYPIVVSTGLVVATITITKLFL